MITKKEIKIKKGTKIDVDYLKLTKNGLMHKLGRDIIVPKGSELNEDTRVITHCKGDICTAIPYDISIFNFIYKIAAAHT